ncbi:hypothetical protein SAMN05443544_1947 [Agromyces cerinus subsp. cerinus]|uniref:Nif11 domain-containing protein n=1 Tax=Agromyces cerinus subsp. cerinus TaxID=232089 RepID=A0A1N6FDB2_9MICO|nr:hypothetical protein SAMN05443544_1947 [Agromyces cerinus subsp. cerinus]
MEAPPQVLTDRKGELGELLRDAADLDSVLDAARALGYRVESREDL